MSARLFSPLLQVFPRVFGLAALGGGGGTVCFPGVGLARHGSSTVIPGRGMVAWAVGVKVKPGLRGDASPQPGQQQARQTIQQDSPEQGTVHQQGASLTQSSEQRFQQLALAQMDFVWRCLRRLGVWEADADDALQQVLLVAHAKLDLIPEGRERAFLFATAARIAANARRSVRRREAAMEQAAVRPKEPQVDQESLSEQLRARATLDEVLDELPEDLRAVFVLFEIEEVAIKDISEMLDLPIGTVGSKLRRARKEFSDAVKRFKAKQDFMPGARS